METSFYNSLLFVVQESEVATNLLLFFTPYLLFILVIQQKALSASSNVSRF